ncbi:MAG: phosphate ABC transporter substrate-binding protein PstS [Desulfomonilaceae bacterium]
MSFRKILLASFLVVIAGMGVSSAKEEGVNKNGLVSLTGAGASFPAPLYTKWFKDYHSKNTNVQVDYQSVGSGAGIKNFINRTVDFGASDAAMTPEEIAKVKGGAQLLPMTAGSIVISYNLKGVPALKLSREAYSGIFLGKIKKWNDPLIAKTNPGVKLPDSTIHVVVRADASGTSYVFSKHLSSINKEFAKNPGFGTMPNWPVGTKSKGNEGVTASILTTPGSIGYLEYGYAKGQNLPMASLENQAGKLVEPTIESAQASLASVKLPENLVAWLPDPPGEKSYPIVTYTWILCYRECSDPQKLEALKNVLEYGMTEGQKNSEQLGYVPLPENVVIKLKAALNNIRSK